MKRNIILFAIAMMVVIAFAGSAQASVTVDGDVNSAVAEGDIVTLWLDDYPNDYVTEPVRDMTPLDYYYFDDISSLLGRNGYGQGSTDIPVTIAMYCSGTERDIDGVLGSSYTNTYRNVTVVHTTVDYTDMTRLPPLMELEPCSIPDPDLIVSDITVNYDALGVKNKAMGPLPPGTKTQSNNISVDITEINGGDITASFDVTFEIGGVLVHTASVSGLAAGATTTVYCDNKFFPIAGVTYTITVTADSVDVIPETDEGNNDMDKTLTAMVNGYKGDGWQDGRNITNLQSHEQGPINLVYSTGDSAMYSAYYSGEWTTYTANWTPSDFGIPATDSCIKKARLYVYYNYDKEPDGDPTDAGDGYYFNLTFNGVEQEVDAHYSDSKSFGSYDYPYGMIAYDVADRFMVTTDNHAELTYTWPTGSFKDNSMTGMLLVVVYNNTETEPERIIWINEGYDSLYARDSYGVSSEEATTYAEFGGYGSILMDEVVGANLVTVAPHANEGGEKNKLTFNDGEWYGVWDSSSYDGATELGINEKDVRTYLKATDNTASFQSHKSGIYKTNPDPYRPDRGDSMEASNAFLVVEYKIPAGVTFDKKKLNLNSNGILKAFITLPEGYDVADIDVATVECEGAPVFGDGSVIPSKQTLEVKFKIPDLEIVEPEDPVELTITGKLYNGASFECSNTLKVV